MLYERPEKTRVGSASRRLASLTKPPWVVAALVATSAAGIALAALRAVDVQFGDVNGQAERLQFRQRLVFLPQSSATKR